MPKLEHRHAFEITLEEKDIVFDFIEVQIVKCDQSRATVLKRSTLKLEGQLNLIQ